jgi:hypothetical protein
VEMVVRNLKISIKIVQEFFTIIIEKNLKIFIIRIKLWT